MEKRKTDIDYFKILESKRHVSIDRGIKPIWMPDKMFDFQKHVAEKSILKGRYADFMDTGLGKTIIELTIAYNYVKHTNKPVLIITPLAVAFQFLNEADKFGVNDVSYSKDGNYKTKIVICNYERLHKFDWKDFDCVILDESSILKNPEGFNRNSITDFLRKVKYRYLFTASPLANDFDEIGTSSEALGELGYTDMLTKFFRNNEDTIKPQNIGTKWLLKPHATDDFFRWVSSWSISMRKPSDLGFSDENYILPELKTNDIFVENKKQWVENGQILLHKKIARTRQEISKEARITLNDRCEKSVEVSSNKKTTVYWVNLNQEADLIEKLDKSSVQLSGRMSIDQKEEILISFSKGEINKLITKPRITSFGLNWQHCNHTVYFPSFSYEQYYQAIRRFWRFGQLYPVTVDRILSEGQIRLKQAIDAKTIKANELYNRLKNSTKNYSINNTKFNKKIIIPSWM